jgi:hypothetical protein
MNKQADNTDEIKIEVKTEEKNVSPNNEELKEISNMCGIVIPISAMGDYSEGHWLEVKRILQRAIKQAGYDSQIVSEAEDSGIIHKRIVQNLYDNPIVVCDISGRNPNVMFELGLRLAFDKPTIIVKDNKTAFSFDTSVIEHLQYPADLRFGKIEEFMESLTVKIKKTMEIYNANPSEYSTFLKNFGKFVTPKIEETQVPIDKYVLEELQNITSKLNRIENFNSSSNSSKAAKLKRLAENNITDSIFYKNVNVTISENVDKKEISTILSALRKIEEVVGFTLDELNNSISLSVLAEYSVYSLCKSLNSLGIYANRISDNSIDIDMVLPF